MNIYYDGNHMIVEDDYIPEVTAFFNRVCRFSDYYFIDIVIIGIMKIGVRLIPFSSTFSLASVIKFWLVLLDQKIISGNRANCSIHIFIEVRICNMLFP